MDFVTFIYRRQSKKIEKYLNFGAEKRFPGQGLSFSQTKMHVSKTPCTDIS